MPSASETYWSQFNVTDKDVERVYSFMLDRGQAASTEELVRLVIGARAAEEQERRSRLSAQAMLYQPKNSVEVGQRLIFSAMNDAEGVVTALRDSDNARIEPFRVLAVRFNDGTEREFAAAFQSAHVLNELKPVATGAADESTEEIFARFGNSIRTKLEARLASDKEFVQKQDQWLLRGLLADVNLGFLNIAEAAIEQNNNAMTTAELAHVLEMDGDPAKRETVLFSLDHALERDERFVDVGPEGQTRWFLDRLVPPEAASTPRVLQLAHVRGGDEPLPPELETILNGLEDDSNVMDTVDRTAASVSLILTYPHRRAGSLPLTAGVRALFPQADKPMLITLVDEYGARLPAWIVPGGSYLFGLKTYYDKAKLNPGALLELVPGAEPFTASIRFQPRREGKSLWVRTAKVDGGRLTFGNLPRPVAFKYDEEMLIVPEDPNGLDKLTASNYGDRSLDALLMDIFPELIKLGSSSIHAKTLYSAVNFAKRVGARAVFGALANNEAFTSTGGGYFVLQPVAARTA